MRNFSQIALAALAVAILASPSKAADADNLLPKETELVIHFNIKQLLESDIVKKSYLPSLKKGFEAKEAQKFLMETGLDPFTDLERITVGLWGKTGEDMNGIMIFRGTFDVKKMLEVAERFAKEKPDTISMVKEGDVELIQLKNAEDKGKPSYLALAEGRPIVGGTDKKLVAASLGVELKAKPSISRELGVLVQQQDAKASIFACGFTEGKIKEFPGDFGPLKNFGIDGEKIKAGIMKMKTIGLTVNFGKEVSVSVKMGMKDNDSADDFSAEFGKLAAAAKTFLPILVAKDAKESALLEDVANTLATSSKGKDAIVTVKFSADAIAKATDKGDEEKKEKDKDKDKEKDK